MLPDASWLCLMQPRNSKIYEYLQETAWKNWLAIDMDSTASASMINIGFALCGVVTTHSMSRSRIITRG